MTSWRYSKAALFVLLAISLALKTAGLLGPADAGTANPVTGVSKMLERRGFTVGEAGSDLDLFSISATSGKCELLVAILSPQGWHSGVIRGLTPPGFRLAVYYDGKTYEVQPVLLTRINDYLDRMLRAAGFERRQKPVIGVVASPGCELDSVPWEEPAT